MPLYRFKEKGPAYGLGYTEGELLEIADGGVLEAACLVNEVYADGQAKGQPTGKMIMSPKKYTVDFLIESGVIVQASAEDKKKWENGKDKNTLADEKAVVEEAKEEKVVAARAEKLKKGK